MVGWQRKVVINHCRSVVLGKEIGYFLAKHTVQLSGCDIFVAGSTTLNAVDDFQGSVDPDIARYEYFLKLIEELVVNSSSAGYCATNLLEYTGFGAFQTFVESFFFLLIEKT